MNGIEAVRQAIAMRMREQAEWRHMKAIEYPEDDRNARAADTLARYAVEVEALADDEPRLVRLATMIGEGEWDDAYAVPVGFGMPEEPEAIFHLSRWNHVRGAATPMEPSLDSLLWEVESCTAAGLAWAWRDGTDVPPTESQVRAVKNGLQLSNPPKSHSRISRAWIDQQTPDQLYDFFLG